MGGEVGGRPVWYRYLEFVRPPRVWVDDHHAQVTSLQRRACLSLLLLGLHARCSSARGIQVARVLNRVARPVKLRLTVLLRLLSESILLVEFRNFNICQNWSQIFVKFQINKTIEIIEFF